MNRDHYSMLSKINSEIIDSYWNSTIYMPIAYRFYIWLLHRMNIEYVFRMSVAGM